MTLRRLILWLSCCRVIELMQLFFPHSTSHSYHDSSCTASLVSRVDPTPACLVDTWDLTITRIPSAWTTPSPTWAWTGCCRTLQWGLIRWSTMLEQDYWQVTGDGVSCVVSRGQNKKCCGTNLCMIFCPSLKCKVCPVSDELLVSCGQYWADTVWHRPGAKLV